MNEIILRIKDFEFFNQEIDEDFNFCIKHDIITILEMIINSIEAEYLE